MPAQESNKRTRLANLSSAAATAALSPARQQPAGTASRIPHGTVRYQDPMAFFSEEIALYILQVLEPVDLGHCACVSRLWHRLANDQMLWRRLFIKYKFSFPRRLATCSNRTSPMNHATASTYDQFTQQQQQQLRSQRPAYTLVQDSRLRQQHALLGSTNESVSPQLKPIALQQPCWKALYRLNYNWIMGQARVSSVSIQDLRLQDQNALSDRSIKIVPSACGPELGQRHRPVVQFQGSVILIASPNGLVHLWRIKHLSTGSGTTPHENVDSRPEFWQTYPHTASSRTSLDDARTESASQITCLALDSSFSSSQSGWQKVVVGYRTGHFSVFEYPKDSALLEAQDRYDNSTPADRSTPLREIGKTEDLPAWNHSGQIETASFVYPILIVCSSDGTISIYMVSDNNSSNGPDQWCRLLHRLYGTSAASPVSMSLEQVMSPLCGGPWIVNDENTAACRWRTLISFGLELYDGSWTVRLQEIEFDEHYILQSAESGADDAHDEATHHSDGHMDNQEGNNAIHRAPINTSSPLDGMSLSPATATAADHARIGAISAINIVWPFVVTTHCDNTLNVFRMTRDRVRTFSGWRPTVSQERLRLDHLSTLYGHCGAVSGVSIEARSGRLVSASMDRSIKVWTMSIRNSGNLTNQQCVHRCSVSISDINKSWTEDGQVTKEEGLGLVWVGSDEEKIVSMNCDGTVKIWHFS